METHIQWKLMYTLHILLLIQYIHTCTYMETHTHAHVITQHSYIVSLQSAHDTNSIQMCVHVCMHVHITYIDT